MNEHVLKIKDISEGFVANLGFSGEAIITQRDNTYFVNFQIEEPMYLIGRFGDGLEALQHVLRLLISRELLPNSVLVVVDINGYRNRRSEVLEKHAREIAHKVRTEGIEIELDPMNSFERRIVHTLVGNIADVESESRGDRRDRRVVIKPKKKS